MKKWIFLLIVLIISVALATTYHTLPFNGQNSFAEDEDFITSTDTVFAYCTWDDQYLYLGISSSFLATANDTSRGRYDTFWAIDTDPHPENPKSGRGTDSSFSYYIQIMEQEPWWFDEQRWIFPFYADYMILAQYNVKDSVYAIMFIYDNENKNWLTSVNIDTADANLNYIDGYYELRIPFDSLGNPQDINILGYSDDGIWKSDLYWDDEYGLTRDVGGTFASWPWTSLVGGDGDKHTHGQFNHWFHFRFQPGISPDQVNDPPVASTIPDQTITVDSTFSSINLNDYVFDDLTPDSLLNWTSQSSELVITIADSNEAFIDVPYPGWVGSDTVTFIVTDQGGKSDTTSAVFTVEDNPSALANQNNLVVNQFTVFQNYPNPFNPTTTIAFGLSKRSDVTIQIINMLGEVIFQKQLSNQSAGLHSLQINASDWASGLYLYRISAENKTITRKMVLVR